MIISPIITPFRWYSKFYDQNRYDVDCSNACEFKLITDRGHLLPFQFTRDASGYKLDSWLLRRACDDAEPKLLSPENSIFYGEFANNWVISGLDCGERTIDTGAKRTLSDGSIRTLEVVYCSTAEKSCNILRSGSTNGGSGQLLNILTVNKSYRLSITIGDLSLVTGSNLYLQFKNGATVLINNVNGLGYFEVEFTAGSTDFSFVVMADITVVATDYIGIEEIQIVELFTQNANDIVLDKNLLTLKNYGAKDYIIYCGESLGQSLPTGDYYSVITSLDGTIFYSEVITVKNFIPSKSNYYILEWRNTCDIQDVIYQPLDGCAFVNRLYLNEAVITKPEYPFKEEGEEDGNKNLNTTFQKWEKDIQFLIGKCPEFIVDSLTGIRLHEIISVTKPVRNGQLQITEATTIKSVEYDVNYILNDCFANVSLKMLLENKYIDSSCCENNVITECSTCGYTVIRPLNDFSPGVANEYAFALGSLDFANGIYHWLEADEQWDLLVVPSNTLVCVQDEVYVLFPFVNQWYLTPSIQNATQQFSPSSFTLYGVARQDSFVQVQIWTDEFPEWSNYNTIFLSSVFPSTGLNVVIPMQDGLLFRIHNYTLNCDYGYSNVWDGFSN